VIRRLALEVMRVMPGYTNEPLRHALIPLSRFVRIVFGDLVLTAADMAPPEPHPLRTKYRAVIDAARKANTAGHESGYLNAGFYAWVFGVAEGAQAMAYMDIAAPGFRDIKLQIPREVFGRMAETYTRMPIPFDPRGELLTGTFINYVLPQIAVHAASNVINSTTARQDLETEYAWRLEQYDTMGLA
jgi:hypothetical protein